MNLNNFAMSLTEVTKSQPGTLTLNFQNLPVLMRYPETVYYQIPVKKTVFRCPNFVENFLRTAERFSEESIPHTYHLACENGHSVGVHRVVLASSSPYLYRIFESLSEWKHPSVIVSGIDQEVLNLLTQFMYTGQAEVPDDLITTFITMAKNLQIRGLENHQAIPFGYIPNDHQYYQSPDSSRSTSPNSPTAPISYPVKKRPFANNLSLLAAVACAMPEMKVTSPSEARKLFSRVPLKMAIKSPDSRYYTQNKENECPPLSKVTKTPAVSVKVTNPFSQINNNVPEMPKRVEKLKHVKAAKENLVRPPVARRSSITSSQDDFSKWKQQLGDRGERLSGVLSQTATPGPIALQAKAVTYQSCPPSTSSSKSEVHPKTQPSTSSNKSGQPSTTSSKKSQPSSSSGASRYPSTPSSSGASRYPSTSSSSGASLYPSPPSSGASLYPSSASSSGACRYPSGSSSSGASTTFDTSYLNCLPSTSTGKTSRVKKPSKAKPKKPSRKSAKSANWKSRQPQECDICYKIFSNKFNLKQHVYNMHYFGGGIECTECDKIVKNKWYLRRHMVTSHNAPLNKKNTKKRIDEDEDDDEDESDYDMVDTFDEDRD